MNEISDPTLRSRWEVIADAMRADIAAGRFAPQGTPIQSGITLFAVDAVQLTVRPDEGPKT